MNKKIRQDSVQEIFWKLRTLILKVERESPLLSNSGVTMTFNSKLMSLQIMQKYTTKKARKLYEAYKKDKESSVFPLNINKYMDECIAFFEAYLNAFYSLLQIIGKISPYFYEKEIANQIPTYNFGEQLTHFKKHPEIDYEYADYLKNNMGWYRELVCNRHAISHNVSAFLGFGEEDVEFIHMEKKRIDYFKSGKPSKKLEKYMKTTWNSLFDFLKFYKDHFSNREIFVDKEKELEELRKILSTQNKT